jgi:hypothetical protein
MMMHTPNVCGSAKGCSNKGVKYTQKKFKIKDLHIFYSSGQTKKEKNNKPHGCCTEYKAVNKRNNMTFPGTV